MSESEKPKFTPGEITFKVTVKAGKDELFDLKVDLDREINLQVECGVLESLEDEEGIIDDLSESGFIQTIAHLMHHEKEEAGGEGPKNDDNPKDLLN